MDVVSKRKRSEMMSNIRSKNTRPEIALRSQLHRAGYRFRIHVKNLPGHPDIVLKKYCAVIFVHGCFWHQHSGCKYAVTPKTRTEFWLNKFSQNVTRDAKVQIDLARLGWRVMTIWECDIKRDLSKVVKEIDTWLQGTQ